jgi:AcrR family transcriptional regulator
MDTPPWQSRFLKRPPVQARSRALVDSVLEAFDQLLRGTDHEREVTVESLLHRAGVGIGSFYEYFTGRDSLIGLLVERANRENFDQLLAAMERDRHETLGEAIDAMARHVAHTYLGHRTRTRVIVAGAGRLGLLPIVTTERDRFARLLAARLQRYLPDEPAARCEAAAIELCDAVIGVIVGELHRPPRPVEDVARQLARMSRALLAALPEAPPGPGE